MPKCISSAQPSLPCAHDDMVKKTSSNDNEKLSHAFFGGKIRDCTTKQSRKAASDLAKTGTAAAAKKAAPVRNSNNNNKNQMEADVRREIHRRIQALSDSGQIFEEHAEYNDSAKDAEDARLIVQVCIGHREIIGPSGLI